MTSGRGENPVLSTKTTRLEAGPSYTLPLISVSYRLMWGDRVPHTEGPHSCREPKHVLSPNVAPTPLARAPPSYCRREDPQGPGYHSTTQVDDFLNGAGPKLTPNLGRTLLLQQRIVKY